MGNFGRGFVRASVAKNSAVFPADWLANVQPVQRFGNRPSKRQSLDAGPPNHGCGIEAASLPQSGQASLATTGTPKRNANRGA